MPDTTAYRVAVLSMHSCPLGGAGSRDTGGMNVYLSEITRRLGEMGYGVDVFTRDKGAAEKVVRPLGRNVRLVHIKTGPREDIPKEELHDHVERFAAEIEGFRRLHRLEYQLIFSNYWLSGLSGNYLQSWWKAAHILMYHTLGEIKNRSGSGEKEPSIRLSSEKNLMTKSHLILAPSHREKEFMLQQFGPPYYHKIRVVPCGVNLNQFRPGDKWKARSRIGMEDIHSPLVLYVGRLEPVKGLERLLEALTWFTIEERPCLVVVGGDIYDNRDSYTRELWKKCRNLSLESHVKFAGRVERELVSYYYNAADLTAVSSYYESFGMVALESLACGTPVITTDVGDLKKIVKQGETGYVLSQGSPREIAGKTHQLLAREMFEPEEVRKTVTSYDWQEIARLMSGVWKEVISKYTVGESAG